MTTDERSLECKVFSERLSRYADGDLSPEETERCRLHLDVCARCRATLESHKRMILLLESAKEREAPWDLEVRVLEAIGFGGARTQLRGYRVSPPVVWIGTVAAMILLGAGWLALRSGVVRVFSAVFGPTGRLSTEEMAGLASKLTRYIVTVWEGLLAGLSTFEPVVRSVGTVSAAAKGNPHVIGTVLGTLVLVFLFFRIMTKEKRSRVVTQGRRSHVRKSR